MARLEKAVDNAERSLQMSGLLSEPAVYSTIAPQRSLFITAFPTYFGPIDKYLCLITSRRTSLILKYLDSYFILFGLPEFEVHHIYTNINIFILIFQLELLLTRLPLYEPLQLLLYFMRNLVPGVDKESRMCCGREDVVVRWV